MVDGDDSIDDVLNDLCERVTGERCVPMWRIGLRIDENVDISNKRIELEEEISEVIGYVPSNVYMTPRGGPAVHENLAIVVEFNEAEVWSSLNRKMKQFREWAEDDPRIGDVGRDVSITVTAGDPEQIIRELEEGFHR